ncbi:MAG TPA: TIM44-like domain-containing protein [Myxococcus sp.]|nr:TIM44-like domain-containing protein [Myxococcus sp.]
MLSRSTRWAPWLPALLALGALALPLAALARGGGGEHYSRPSSGDGDGDGEIPLWLIFEVVRLGFRYPKVVLPLLVLGGVAYWFYKTRMHPDATTRRAIELREADQHTQTSWRDVPGWVNALKLKDPAFELQPVLDRTQRLFLELQQAWFRRDMTPVRPYLSDATWQRFNVQLQLLADQGVRDALADVEVTDVGLIGLDQSPWFDSIHVRIHARMRDTDVPASFSDEQAEKAARKARQEPFTEVWTFVRKPGAQTKAGVAQGQCPNCGAPFNGGAANRCEFCGAVVNSGNYDWTLSEITQGVEYVRHHKTVDGLREAREADPALNLEILEDRASLLFWKWVDAQSRGDVNRLSKVAREEAVDRLGSELEALRKRGRRRVFLECAVGAADVRSFGLDSQGFDQAHVEVRWSARMGVGPTHEKPPQLPTVPQRHVLTLVRRHGAQTNTTNGMSTDRCPQCNAPLTDSAATSCDYCGTQLGGGERDWVLASALPYEAWTVEQDQRHQASVLRKAVALQEARQRGPDRGVDTVMDAQERQRLLYMMAAIAAADGEVSSGERKLLKLCSERWGVQWSNVEMALGAGDQLFERLVPRGGPEAELFLRNIIEMAMVDGRIDRKERRMLESAAAHLGLQERLASMLGGL